MISDLRYAKECRSDPKLAIRGDKQTLDRGCGGRAGCPCLLWKAANFIPSNWNKPPSEPIQSVPSRSWIIEKMPCGAPSRAVHEVWSSWESFHGSATQRFGTSRMISTMRDITRVQLWCTHAFRAPDTSLNQYARCGRIRVIEGAMTKKVTRNPRQCNPRIKCPQALAASVGFRSPKSHSRSDEF